MRSESRGLSLRASDAAVEGREHLAEAARSKGSADADSSASRSAARMQWVHEEITEMSVVFRDLATGLCDFLGVREREPVYLRWRLGEDEVTWGGRASASPMAQPAWERRPVAVAVAAVRSRPRPPTQPT